MSKYTSIQYDTLNNKTFHGLLIAEFLAAFNDQCIHASAMFFAIRKQVLTEGTAISLMPLLFYSPWFLFATLSGYFADKLSKRSSLIFWKVAEVGITGLALLGFWIGSAFSGGLDVLGPWLLMACVFLMGTHSAFYVPNKYGVLPEIFTVRSLSKANGLIESTTFLAIILGTVTGGWLSKEFEDREWWIGIILVGLALIGTLTSFLIHRMPPADPERKFPGWAPARLFRPLFQNLAVLLRGRLSSVAVLGLSFFTFMVAYMRATMYMYGQSQNPRWDEAKTSLIVAVVSLGVGLGSPLAGYLSGRRVELGLVPLGALGMVAALVLAGVNIFSVTTLIVSLVLIGLFASFYLVPLYSMLQYSAPKGSKGASVATNNFVATTGAILASVVFFVLVTAARWTGLAEPFDARDVLGDTGEAVVGKLVTLEGKRHHPTRIVIQTEAMQSGRWAKRAVPGARLTPEEAGELPAKNMISLDDEVPDPRHEQATVAVSKHSLRGINYYQIRLAERPVPTIYNNEEVPRYLFLGAAVLMFLILCLLCLRLPDFFLRTALWFRWLGRRKLLQPSGQEKLTGEPVILATNCRDLRECLHVTASTVRPIKHVVPRGADGTSGLIGFLARRAETIYYSPIDGAQGLDGAAQAAARALRRGNLVSLSTGASAEAFDQLLEEVQRDSPVKVIPVYFSTTQAASVDGEAVRVVFGEPLRAGATGTEVREALGQLDPQ